MEQRKVALITGANKGVGYEVARGLGQLGIAVLVGARDAQRGEQAAARLRAEGLDARFLLLDVTDEESIAHAVDQLDRLDILVNNAGVTEDMSLLPSQTSAAAVRAVYETNVFGVVAVTNAVLPLLRRSAAGRVVNVSSRLGSLASNTDPDTELPMLLAYASSKSALNGITVQYARELRGTPIKVNACTPGPCTTDLNPVGPLTAEQGAAIVVALATVDDHGPTAGFFAEDGELAW